ncbi:MAG: hypothetical protein JW862_18920 [Anaerolineales bacterium]|nr:hypothetical protein [Anaerolineales bacterium]
MKTTKMILLFISLLLAFAFLAACQPADYDGVPLDETPREEPPPVDSEQTETLNPQFAPQLGDEELRRGEVFINTTELLLLESYPVQINMIVQGDLPTPCHELRVVVSEPDAQGNIEVEAYSLVDPNQICIQVMEPFEISLSLGSYTQGSFTVLINGEPVESFELP